VTGIGSLNEKVASVWADPAQFNAATAQSRQYVRSFGYTPIPQTNKVVLPRTALGFNGDGGYNAAGHFLTGRRATGVGVHFGTKGSRRGFDMVENANDLDQLGFVGQNGEFYPIWGHFTQMDAKGGNTRSDAKGGDTGSVEDESVPKTGGAPAPQGGPRIVINPSTFKNSKDALCVAFNERFRIAMEQYGFEPKSEQPDLPGFAGVDEIEPSVSDVEWATSIR
jgi:hypothetical protein